MVSTILKYGAIGAGAVILITVGYYLLKDNPKKLYKKAMSLHKQGELYYNDGDSELAEEYYREAEMLRDKARRLC